MKILELLSDKRSFGRDFARTGFLIVFAATVAANIMAFVFNTEERHIETVAATPPKVDGIRTYTEVRSVLDGPAGPRVSDVNRSVLDDDIITGTSRSKLGKIDPCGDRR